MVGCFRFVKLPLDYLVITLYHWFGQAMPGYFMTPSSCWDARTLCRPSNGPVHQIHLLMKRGPRVGRWRGHWPSPLIPCRCLPINKRLVMKQLDKPFKKSTETGRRGCLCGGKFWEQPRGKGWKRDGQSISININQINQYHSVMFLFVKYFKFNKC